MAPSAEPAQVSQAGIAGRPRPYFEKQLARRSSSVTVSKEDQRHQELGSQPRQRPHRNRPALGLCPRPAPHLHPSPLCREGRAHRRAMSPPKVPCHVLPVADAVSASSGSKHTASLAPRRRRPALLTAMRRGRGPQGGASRGGPLCTTVRRSVAPSERSWVHFPEKFSELCFAGRSDFTAFQLFTKVNRSRTGSSARSWAHFRPCGVLSTFWICSFHLRVPTRFHSSFSHFARRNWIQLCSFPSH